MESHMNSRERVLCAIRHERPDRTPRDFWAEKPALNRLFARLGHQDEEQVLQMLGIDIRHLNARTPDEIEISPGTFQNFWGERYVYKPTQWGPMREDSKGALADADSLAELEAFQYPNPDTFDYSNLAQQCRHNETYALLYGFADVWQRPALVRGWEAWLMDMIDHPEMVHFLSRKFTDFYLEDYTRAAEASKGRIDIYLLISDLGTQRGPLISPAMFQKFVAPYIKEMADHIHGLGGKVLFHSCGMIHEFIPELIRLGVDVLDPIQPVGPIMSPERLKTDFGGKICFHGGIDMQNILTLGTTEQVNQEVKRYCETFNNGDYILCPAHLFQPDVPPENILAVYGKK